MTTDEIEAERQRFEAWMTAKYGNVGFGRDAAGAYRPWINENWTGWLAAIASERDRRKQEQDAANEVTKNLGRFWPSGERAE